MAITFFSAPADLAADDVGVGVDPEQLAGEDLLQLVGDVVVAEWPRPWPRRGRPGSPWPGSGPVSTPTGWPGSTSLMTSVMRRWVPCSRPLVRLTTGTHGRSAARPRRASARKPCDGTPITTTSAAAARPPRGRTWPRRSSGRSKPAGRRCCGGSVDLARPASGRRAHSTVGALRGARCGDRGAPRPGADRPRPGSSWRHRNPRPPDVGGPAAPARRYARVPAVTAATPSRRRAGAGEGVRPGQGPAGRRARPGERGRRSPGDGRAAWCSAAGPLPVARRVRRRRGARRGPSASGAERRLGPGRGLNGAVADGVAALAAAGARPRSIVAHADLPLATDLDLAGRLRRRHARARPPRRRHQRAGRARPRPASAFAYGPGSFGRHRAEAARARPARCASCATRPRRGTSTCPPTSPPRSLSSPTAADEPAPVAPDRRLRPPPSRPTGVAIDVDLPTPPWPWPSAPIPTTSSSAAAPRSPSGRPPAASCTTSSAPTGRRARGTPTRTPPRSSPPARPSSGPRRPALGRHRRGRVPRAARRRARARACGSGGEVAYWIRELRPDVVLGHDPWKRYRLHPDHRHAGFLTVDGVVAARDPHFFPEQELAAPPARRAAAVRGRRARPRRGRRRADLTRKLAALEAHVSQLRSTMDVEAGSPAEATQLDAFRAGCGPGWSSTARWRASHWARRSPP